MKHAFYILIAVAILMGCNHPDKEIMQHINKSDSVAINYFKGDGTTDTVVAVKIIRDKAIITQLTNMIAAKTIVQNYKCGYDGSLHFFKMNKVIQDIYFTMNENDCMQFSFVQEDKHIYTGLSSAAKDLLLSVRK